MAQRKVEVFDDEDAGDAPIAQTALVPVPHDVDGEGAKQDVVIFPSASNSRVVPGNVRQPSEAEIEMIRRMAGSSFLADPGKLAVLVSTMDSVREQSMRGVMSAIQIGRDMNHLRDSVDPREWRAAMRESKALFCGWSRGNLTKAMGAAEFMDRGWVPVEVLPASYTTLYHLGDLGKEEVNAAVGRHLISPSMRRRDAEHLRAELARSVEPERHPQVSDQAHLPPEVLKIDKQIAAARKSIRSLQNERRKLMASQPAA